MNEKNRFLYNATAHIDENLIDALTGGEARPDQSPETAAPERKRRTKPGKTLAAALAAALAVSLFVGGVFVWQNRKEGTGKKTVEPFKGTPGNYAGARFMSIADTSKTVSSVYGQSFFYDENYRKHISSVSAFFDRITESLLNGQENAVVSPVNIYMALSLLAESTDGTSRGQILDVLGVPGIEELREQSKRIWLETNTAGRSSATPFGFPAISPSGKPASSSSTTSILRLCLWGTLPTTTIKTH